MQAWSRFLRGVVGRPVRQAWGLAANGPTWSLVGLSLQTPDLVRVHTTRQLLCADRFSSEGLGAQLREVGMTRGRSRHRVSMALEADQLVSGVLEFPAQMPHDDWVTEVQLEVSQMIGKAPDEVNFDFHPEARSDGAVQRVHWVGCSQSQIDDFKSCARFAGWQLDSVEPAVHAAQRAASSLQGGLVSLLTQPTQDWQFGLDRIRGASEPEPFHPLAFMSDPALQQAMKSEAGSRLVASGLALKAWL